MLLCAMVAADEDALICDFAETYHIYQWRKLSVKYAAVLAFGLREDSRIRQSLSKSRVTLDLMLKASMVDALNILVWSKSKDAQKHRNRPESILTMLTRDRKPENEVQSFASAEEFEARRREILERSINGN